MIVQCPLMGSGILWNLNLKWMSMANQHRRFGLLPLHPSLARTIARFSLLWPFVWLQTHSPSSTKIQMYQAFALIITLCQFLTFVAAQACLHTDGVYGVTQVSCYPSAMNWYNAGACKRRDNLLCNHWQLHPCSGIFFHHWSNPRILRFLFFGYGFCRWNNILLYHFNWICYSTYYHNSDVSISDSQYTQWTCYFCNFCPSIT